MSTVGRINLEPVSDILSIQRRDFPLADPTLANPDNANALVDGEWMTLDNNSQLIRAAAIAMAGTAAALRSWVLFAQRGRYDVQAMAGHKTDILWLGDYEADSTVFDAAAAVGMGAAVTAVGQGLKVASVTIGGTVFSGLVGHGGTAGGDTDPLVGYVTRLPANNGGRLRYRSGSAILP